MPNQENKPELLEGRLLHPEGYKCFTETPLKRGYCCKSGCRHYYKRQKKNRNNQVKQYFILPIN
jgi:hypothetical protein